MSFKINDTEIVINGKSIVRALIVVYLAKKIISRPKPEYYVVINTELQNEQKVANQVKVKKKSGVKKTITDIVYMLLYGGKTKHGSH